MKKLLICGVLSTGFLTSVSAQTVILSEDFQQGIPGSWTIVINDTNTVDTTVIEFAPGWIAVADPENPSDTVAGATSFFMEPAQADRWLISPAFTVGAYGNFLGWNARSHDPSFQDGYYVLASTTNTDLASFTDTIAAIGLEDPDWNDRLVNLSAFGYTNQTIHVAFVLRSEDAFKLYVDDIVVTIDDPVGIGELANAPEVTLYPNPATETIAVKGDDIEAIRIFSMNGQLVLQQPTIAGQTVAISCLQNGAYIVEIQTASGVARKKLLKK